MIKCNDSKGVAWQGELRPTTIGATLELTEQKVGGGTITVRLDHAEVGKLLLGTISLMASLYDSQYGLAEPGQC